MDQVKYGKFEYHWKGKEFILYIAEGADGQGDYNRTANNYLLGTEEVDSDEDETEDDVSAESEWGGLSESDGTTGER